ncbi:hypothetical protein D3C78_416830 [compost metagenome]
MRAHDEAVIEMIRNDPDFTVEYLRVAFEELDEEGGEAGFLTALRHVGEASGGMAEIAAKAGLSSEAVAERLDDLDLAGEVRARLESGERPVRVPLDELIAEAEGDLEAGKRGE